MATSSNRRDVKLGVEIETAGEENLKRIAAEVRALAKAGGDAAPQYVELANAIERNADVARELLAFKTAAEAIEKTSLAADEATASAQRLRAEYDRQAESTQALQANQRRVAEALAATKRELLGAAEQASVAKNALRGADDSTGSLAKTSQEAADRVAGLKKRVGELALDLASTKAEASAAEGVLRKLADQSLRADEASRSQSSALRAQVQAMEQARLAAAQLGVEVVDAASASERLEAALRDGAGAREAAVALERLTTEERQAKAAVEALTEDLDRQAAAVRGRLVPALQTASDAYEKEQAAIRESLALAERESFEATKKAALKQRLIQLQAEDAAILRGETAERQRATIAAESELAAIRESEKFLVAYNLAKLQAVAGAKALTEALKQETASAFSTIQVRGVAEIRAEIAATSAALQTLESRFAAGAISAYDLQRATGAAALRMQTLQAELRQIPAAVGGVERLSAAVLDLATRFGALGAAAATIGFVAKPVLDANLALDSMRRVLTTVYGSAEEAARQIDFVRRVSADAGLNVASAGEAFAKFAASAKQSGISTELVQRVFKATADAAGNLGLSSEKTTSILNALGQMANKGTVSMEELRQQLGDALPGALSLLAKGLGITEPQLVKLVESGKLLTSEALGPLAEAMTALAAPGGRVEGLRAAMERLANQFRLAYQSISDTSFYRGLVAVIGGIADNFGAATTAVKLFAEALLVSKVATAIGNFIGLKTATIDATAATARHTAVVAEDTAVTGANTAATGANTAALGANTAIKGANAAATAAASAAAGRNAAAWTEVAGALAKTTPQIAEVAAKQGLLSRAAGGVVTALGGKAAALVTAGIVLLEFKDKLIAAAASMAGYKDRTEEVVASLKSVEKAAREGNAAREAEGGSLVKAKVRYAEQAETLGKATAAAERNVKAAKALGEAAVLSAELSADEALKLKATTAAREGDLTALTALAQKKQEEVTLTQGLIAATEKFLQGKGELSKADQAELSLLRDKRDLLGVLTKGERERLNQLSITEDLAKKSMDSTREQLRLDREKLEGLKAAAEEASAEVKREEARLLQAKQAQATYRDNSKSVEQLRVEMDLARESAAAWQALEKQGLATKEQVAAADHRAAAAVGVYKDAVNDAIAAIKRRAEAQKELQGLQKQDLELARLKIQTDEKIADLTGGFQDRLANQIKLKELDLQASRNDIAALTQASAALREEAAARAGVLKVTDENYDAKKREIDALYASALANDKARLAEQERLRLADLQLGILNGTLYQGAKGWDSYGKQVDLTTGKLLRSSDAADKLGESLSKLKQNQYDAEKFALAADGSRFAASDGTVDPLAAKAAQSEFDAASKAYSLALDKVQNYGKYFLTTGVSPSTTAQRQAALQGDLSAAFANLQQAQVKKDAADRQASFAKTAALIPAAPNAAETIDLSGLGANTDSTQLQAILQRLETALSKPTPSPTTVNINTGSLRGTVGINVASSADAARLQSLLQQIIQDMARSGG